MDRIIMAACAAALALPISAHAQEQAATPVAPLKRIEAPISAGTPVTLRSMVATSTIQVGSVVPFELVNPIVVNGRTVVPAGAQATAIVSTVDKGTASKPGRVAGRLQSLQYGSHNIRLIGGFEGTGSLGSEPRVPAGLSINGYVDENVPAWTPPASLPPRPVPVAPAVVVDSRSTSPTIRAIPVPPSTAVTVDTKTETKTEVVATARPAGKLALDLGAVEATRTVQATRIIETIKALPKSAPKVVSLKSKVTSRDVTVESGGTTTHYVY